VSVNNQRRQSSGKNKIERKEKYLFASEYLIERRKTTTRPKFERIINPPSRSL
jgi:hypothetical protein